MKRIKKLIAWILIFALIVPTIGCGAGGSGGQTARILFTTTAEENVSTEEGVRFLVETDSAGETFTYRYEDGPIFDDEELKQIAEDSTRIHAAINFVLV